MSDDLVKRHVEVLRLTGGDLGDLCQPLADAIEALIAKRDEALNQLDSAIHSQIVLEKRTAAVMEDRKFILEERDRTFALMLARAEAAEAECDRLRALPAVQPVTVRLVFANADATPKTTVLDVSAASVPDIMTWYGAYCSGDRYTVTMDGRNVPMDQNGEPTKGERND